MESNDQANEQSYNDQPQDGGSEQPQTDSLIDVNWEKIDIEELKKWYLRQSDYTRKTQELSKLKKESELTPEEKTALDFFKNNGFATKEDLENLLHTTKQDTNLKEIISSNPDLAPYEKAIKDLSNKLWIAVEDVIEKYGFKSKDKLAKAKNQGDIKGIQPKQKSIMEMNSKEYAEYKAKLWIGKKSWWFI